METFMKVKKIVDKIMSWICIVILAIMTFLVTYQVVTRYVFGKPSAISEATAQYLFVWVVMFGSALVFGERGHLEITTVKSKMSPKVYMINDIVINICLVLFSAVICVWGGAVITMAQSGTVDAALQISRGIIYASIPFCGVVMVFYGVFNIFLAVYEYKNNIRVSMEDNAGTM